MAGLAPTTAQAAQSSLYVATDVPVDATAGNAVEAREKAVAQGIQAGLRQVLGRLTAPADQGRLPTPSTREAEGMVLGMSFAEERTSAVRYLAKMTIRFVPQAVRGLLDRSGVPYTDTQARTVVIVPVWKGGADSPPVLWEEPNPWRAAWAGRPRGGLVPVEVPLGDLQDVSALDAQKAVSLEPSSLETLAARYAAGEAVVAVATLRAGGQPVPTVDVRALHSANPGTPLSLSVTGSGGEGLDAVLARAATQLAGALEGEWKASSLTFSGGGDTLTMTIPVASLDDWMSLRRRLEGSAAVRKITVLALARDKVLASVSHGGTAEQFAQSLTPRGLSLTQDPVAGWVLTNAAPAAPEAPTPPDGAAAPAAPPMETAPGQVLAPPPAAAPAASGPTPAVQVDPAALPPAAAPTPLPSVTQPVR